MKCLVVFSYINTAAKAGGVVRGQIVKDPDCPFEVTSIFNPSNVNDGIELTQNQPIEFLDITLPEQLRGEVRIQTIDLQGRIILEKSVVDFDVEGKMSCFILSINITVND